MENIEIDVDMELQVNSDSENSVLCPLSKKGILVSGVVHLFLTSLLSMLHVLADVLDNSEIERACINATTTLMDWKILAQKCSLRASREHLVCKSDQEQLLITCWSL